MINSVIHLKQYHMDVVTWDEAINNVYKSIARGEDHKYNPPSLWLTHSGGEIPRVRKLMNKMKLNYAHVYFDAPVSGTGFGPHKDDMDIWFWQCQGSTKWITEKSIYVLNPGDVLFVAAGVIHEVVGPSESSESSS